MKKLLFTIFCVGGFISVKAQTNESHLKVDTIYSSPPRVSETPPVFQGGQRKLDTYLRKNMRSITDDRIPGRVYVTFIIEKDGSLTDIKITKSLSPDTDEEALRLIKKMPNWNPGIQNGQPVRVQYSLPITFE